MTLPSTLQTLNTESIVAFGVAMGEHSRGCASLQLTYQPEGLLHVLMGPDHLTGGFLNAVNDRCLT